jgi:hypothetical protein
MSADNRTVNEIKLAVDAITGTTTDTDNIRRWINACNLKYVQPVIRLVASTSIPTVVGTQWYNLPVDLYNNEILSIKVGDGKLTNQLSFDATDTNLEEYEYKLWNGQICISSPTVVSTLNIFYIRKIEVITGDVITDLPNEFRDIYVDYCAKRQMRKDDEAGLEDGFGEDFDDSLSLLNQIRHDNLNNLLGPFEWRVIRQ